MSGLKNQQDQGNPQPTEKPENWLFQKIKENPFQFLWPLGLAFGGAILIGFFFQIGFMPDMSFSEASGIFIAATLIGLIITFPIFLAMIPAILIQTSKIAIDIYKKNNLFCCTTGLLIILIFLIAICPSYRNHIYAVYFFLCFLISYLRAENKSCLKKIRFCCRKIRFCWKKNKTCQEKIRFCWKKITSPSQHQKIYFIFIDTLAWSTFPIILFFLFYKYEGFEQNSVFPFVFWTILSSVFAWILIIFSDENDLRLWPTVFISYIAISLLLTGGITKIPSEIISSLGLGESQVRVLLKDEGCDAFNAISRSTEEGKICKDNSVDSVYLKSRIASPYVFERHKNNEVLWRITIPKEYVVSLIFQKQNSGQNNESQSSGPSAQNNQPLDSSSPNKTPAQTSPAKCLTACCMCCVPAASCHVSPNCPPKAKQESESRAQPC